MTKGGQFKTVTVAALVALVWMAAKRAPHSAAVQRLASRRGRGSSPLKPGEGASAPLPSRPSWRLPIRLRPSRLTVARGAFSLSLDQFLAKRGGSAIVARGRALKQSNAALFASIQQRYGVPPGPLLAIWGMETGFGRSARESERSVGGGYSRL